MGPAVLRSICTQGHFTSSSHRGICRDAAGRGACPSEHLVFAAAFALASVNVDLIINC